MPGENEQQRLYFEDLKIGQSFTSRKYELTEAEIVEFATKYDPQPFHLDAELAKATLLRGLAASGVLNHAAVGRAYPYRRRNCWWRWRGRALRQRAQPVIGMGASCLKITGCQPISRESEKIDFGNSAINVLVQDADCELCHCWPRADRTVDRSRAPDGA